MIRRLGVATVAALLLLPIVSAPVSADLSDEFTPGSCITQATQTTPFVDVPPGRFFTNPVGWAFLNEITVGTDASHFSPDALVTRAQFATFLHRMLCEPAAGDSAPFSDLVDGAFYDAAVDWLWENGFTTGKPGNLYDPDGLLTRGELAAFLYRLVGEPSGSAVNPFGDVDRNRFFALPIDWLFAREITTGTSRHRRSAPDASGDPGPGRDVPVPAQHRGGRADRPVRDSISTFSTVLSGLAAIPPRRSPIRSTVRSTSPSRTGRLKRVPGDRLGCIRTVSRRVRRPRSSIITGPVVSGGERGLLECRHQR